MTSGKLVWNFLETISYIFFFGPFPLVPATNISLGYSNSYWDSYQPPVHSPAGHHRELYKMSVTTCYPPIENLQWLMLHLWQNPRSFPWSSSSDAPTRYGPSLLSEFILYHWAILTRATTTLDLSLSFHMTRLIPMGAPVAPTALPAILCSQISGSFLSLRSQLKRLLHRWVFPTSMYCGRSTLPCHACSTTSLCFSVCTHVSPPKFFLFIPFVYLVITYLYAQERKYCENGTLSECFVHLAPVPLNSAPRDAQ